ncbi:MAG: hypothetical protein II725_06840 [Firmicutes bacterium]|nr:hypothetical protein [Bacillota bacterium]
MSEHGKKIAGAIAAAAVMIAYYAVFFCIIIFSNESRTAKILLGIIPAVLIFGLVYVCLQRIEEIKGGEEDDLGKY